MLKTKLFALSFICFITTNIFADNLILSQHQASLEVVKPEPSMNNSEAVATPDPAIMDQIKKDWNAAMSGALIPKLDDSMSWAGGTLTRIAPGKMEYVNRRNGTFSQILDFNTDLVALAKKSGDINTAWIAQYGVDLNGSMAFSPNNQVQQDGNKKAVNDTYTHGVSSTYTKDRPYDLGFGIGAFSDKGTTKFALKGQTLDLNQLMSTNEYKALTGANMVYVEAKKEEIPVTNNGSSIQTFQNSSVGNTIDYIKAVKDSSVDMLFKASAKYNAGAITKVQYNQVAWQARQMADYYNKTKRHLVSTGVSEIHEEFTKTRDFNNPLDKISLVKTASTELNSTDKIRNEYVDSLISDKEMRCLGNNKIKEYYLDYSKCNADAPEDDPCVALAFAKHYPNKSPMYGKALSNQEGYIAGDCSENARIVRDSKAREAAAVLKYPKAMCGAEIIFYDKEGKQISKSFLNKETHSSYAGSSTGCALNGSCYAYKAKLIINQPSKNAICKFGILCPDDVSKYIPPFDYDYYSQNKEPREFQLDCGNSTIQFTLEDIVNTSHHQN